MTLRPAKRLGQELLNAGLIDPSRLARAFRWQEEEGTRLGTVLLKLNYIEERVLLAFLARRINVEPVLLREQWIDPAAASLITAATARQTNAIPFALGEDRSVVVAMTDPDNLYALDDLRAATGLRIEPRLASDPAVAETLERLYPLEEEAEEPLDDELAASSSARFEEPMGTGEVTDLASRLMEQVLPWLPLIANGSVEKLAASLPADLLRLATVLKHRLDAAPRAREAARDLAKRPADVDLQAQLRVQIRQLLRVNPPFASEVRTCLGRAGSLGSR
ncbi:MAG: hypothetical protein U0610_27645 [bacterium]